MFETTDGAFDVVNPCGEFSIPEAEQIWGVCTGVGMCVKPPDWQVAW